MNGQAGGQTLFLLIGNAIVKTYLATCDLVAKSSVFIDDLISRHPT